MKTPNSDQLQKKSMLHNRRTIFTVLLCIIIIILLNIRAVLNSISPNGLGLSNEMVQYNSPSGQYSMLVSTKWIILDFPTEKDNNTSLKTSIGSPFSSIEIYVSNKEFNSTLANDIISWGKINTQKNATEYTEINFSEISNERRKGFLNEYSKDIISPFVSFYWNSKSMHCFDYYFIENKYVYSFSFCSVEKVWSNANVLFEKLINSIVIE